MKIELKYGLITALLLCVWVLIEYALGFHNSHFETGKYSGYFSVLIPIVTIYLALKEKREQSPTKNLTFGQGLKTGLMVSLITAAITVSFWYLYNNFINPEWRGQALEWERGKLLDKGKSPEEIEKQLQASGRMLSDSFQLISGFTSAIFFGLFISAIETLILQKPKNPPKAQ